MSGGKGTAIACKDSRNGSANEQLLQAGRLGVTAARLEPSRRCFSVRTSVLTSSGAQPRINFERLRACSACCRKKQQQRSEVGRRNFEASTILPMSTRGALEFVHWHDAEETMSESQAMSAERWATHCRLEIVSSAPWWGWGSSPFRAQTSLLDTGTMWYCGRAVRMLSRGEAEVDPFGWSLSSGRSGDFCELSSHTHLLARGRDLHDMLVPWDPLPGYILVSAAQCKGEIC